MPSSTDQPMTACGHEETAHPPMTFAKRLAFFRQAVRRIIGAPDYEVYLAHHRRAHPDATPMTEKEFFRFAIERRYSRAGPRCC